MKILLLRLSAGILCLGMLGAAACSGCSQTPAADAKSDPALNQQTYTCGRGTHKVGNACVADVTPTNAQGGSTSGANTLKTTGNN